MPSPHSAMRSASIWPHRPPRKPSTPRSSVNAKRGVAMSDEHLFAQLAISLHREAVVLASVLHTRGATPRKRGARMLIAAERCAFSVGGGMAEVRVIAAARALLANRQRQSTVVIDLSGGADAAGVCGGDRKSTRLNSS